MTQYSGSSAEMVHMVHMAIGVTHGLIANFVFGICKFKCTRTMKKEQKKAKTNKHNK